MSVILFTSDDLAKFAADVVRAYTMAAGLGVAITNQVSAFYVNVEELMVEYSVLNTDCYNEKYHERELPVTFDELDEAMTQAQQEQHFGFYDRTPGLLYNACECQADVDRFPKIYDVVQDFVGAVIKAYNDKLVNEAYKAQRELTAALFASGEATNPKRGKTINGQKYRGYDLVSYQGETITCYAFKEAVKARLLKDGKVTQKALGLINAQESHQAYMDMMSR